MYSVMFSDYVQVTHKLQGLHFGNKQNLHGNTFQITVEIFASELDEFNQIIDENVGVQIISKVLSLYNNKNLNEIPELKDKITTPSFIASFLAEKVLRQISLIDIPNKSINQIKVTLKDPAVSLSSSYWKQIDPS